VRNAQFWLTLPVLGRRLWTVAMARDPRQEGIAVGERSGQRR
jgi:hypothetical protein